MGNCFFPTLLILLLLTELHQLPAAPQDVIVTESFLFYPGKHPSVGQLSRTNSTLCADSPGDWELSVNFRIATSDDAQIVRNTHRERETRKLNENNDEMNFPHGFSMCSFHSIALGIVELIGK